MKNFLLIVLLMITIMISANPKIKFKNTTVDFGKIEAGKTIPIAFPFENIGSSELKIEQIKASCGCTAVDLDKKEYKPGEKGEIILTFRSQGFMGQVNKSASVFVNDVDNPIVNIRFTGEVFMDEYANIEIEPGMIDFGKVQIGKQYEKEITIKNNGRKKNLILYAVNHDVLLYPVFKANTIPAGKTTVCRIILTPFEAGFYNGTITFRSNSFRQGVVPMQIKANVIE